MSHRASARNLLLSLVAFLVFMVVLLPALGGVGTVELGIWLLLVVGGVLLIVRRHRKAGAITRDAERSG